MALAGEETLLFDYVKIETGSSEYLLLIYVFLVFGMEIVHKNSKL